MAAPGRPIVGTIREMQRTSSTSASWIQRSTRILRLKDFTPRPHREADKGLLAITWRFLLPAPPDKRWDGMAVWGADDKTLDALRLADLASHVEAGEHGSTAECVVVLPGATDHIRAAAQAVRRGGTLLVLVDRRRRGCWTLTPGRVRAAVGDPLRAAGTWVAAPRAASARRYIPIDTAAGPRWYLDALFIPGTAPSAAFSVAARTAIRIGGSAWISGVAPSFGIVFQAQPHRIEPGALRAAPLPAELRDAGARPLVITSGQDGASRVTLLPLRESDRHPIVAVKVSTDPAFNMDTEAEFHRLRELHATVDCDTAASIPRPVGIADLDGLALTVQSGARGQLMERSSGRLLASPRARLEDLRTAARWISAFHASTLRDRVEWTTELATEAVLEPLDRLLTDRGHLVDADLVRAVVAQRCERAYGSTIPLVSQHFDFAPCNVFIDQPALTVLDWELSASRLRDDPGLPLRDLLFMVSYWYFLVHRVSGVNEELTALRRLVSLDGPFDRYRLAAHDAIRRYCVDLDLVPAFVPVAFAALWVERATYHIERGRAVDPDRGPGTPVNTCVRYLGAITLTS
jgi:hypothetical protein